MTRPASGPGRLLERNGDVTPRGMTVLDRTRLIGRLRHFPFFPGATLRQGPCRGTIGFPWFPCKARAWFREPLASMTSTSVGAAASGRVLPLARAGKPRLLPRQHRSRPSCSGGRHRGRPNVAVQDGGRDGRVKESVPTRVDPQSQNLRLNSDLWKTFELFSQDCRKPLTQQAIFSFESC